MLSQLDAWDLMTAVKHMDHRSATREDAALFAQVINRACEPSLGECLNAVGAWFGTHHDFGLIQPGDIADLVKAARPSARLTRNQVDRALIAQGLCGEQLWLAQRQVPKLVDRGMGLHQAARQAADDNRNRRLPTRPQKPRRPAGHHFAGRIGGTALGDIIGGQS